METSGDGRGGGRVARGRKNDLDGEAAEKKNGAGQFQPEDGRGGRDRDGHLIHLTMGEEGDGAFVAVFVGIVMQPLVQGGTDGKGVEEQHQSHQQRPGQGRNHSAKLVFSVLQNIRNISPKR